MKPFLYSLALILVSLIFIFCKSTSLSAQPVITSFSPTEGEVGNTVNINGSGFNPSAPNDVYFGAIKLVANGNATGTQITVNVPAGVGSIFPITVRNNATHLQASSLSSTTPLFNLKQPSPLTIAPANYTYLPFISTGDGAEALSVGDMNNDGNPDVVVSNLNNYSISVLLGDGNGNFPIQNSFPAGSSTTPSAGRNVIADFDNDGSLDIAVLNDDNELVILINDSTGTSFTPTYLPTGGSIPAGLASGDFDKDGDIDLIITNAGFAPMTNYINILLNDGSGISFVSTTINPGAGNSPSEITVGDFDEDGDIDAVVMINANLHPLTNDGTGSFILGSPIYTGAFNVRELVIGDFNGDDDIDIGVLQYSAGVLMLLGNGSFSFSSSSVSTGSFANTGMSVADLNADGIDDLIIANGYTDQVAILLGDNSGTSFTIIPLDLSPFGADNILKVAVGDFDKDGKPDFVSSQYSSGGILVSLYSLAPPVALAATNVTTSGFFANWTNTGASSYDVEFANNLGFTGSTIIPNLTTTSTSISVPFFGTTYYYRVRNTGSPNFSNIRTVVIPPAAGSHRALQFNGSSSYVQSNNTLNTSLGTGTFTIEAWIKYDALPANDITIAHSSELTNNPFDAKYWRFYIEPSSGYLELNISDGIYSATASSSTFVPNAEWTHVAVSRDATGNITFYINGIAYSGGIDATNFSNNGPLRIGATRGTMGSPTDDPNALPTDVFDGEIDELRIWKSARSAVQIRDLMCRKLIGNEANLIAYYRFDEFTGIRTENRAIGSDTEGVLNGAVRLVSGAALGDVSSHRYISPGTTSLPDFSASFTGGGIDKGVQIYKVTDTPNFLAYNGLTSLFSTEYFGVFLVNIPSVDVTYDYTLKPLQNTGTATENELRLGSRANNTITSWNIASTTSHLNTTTNTITLTGLTNVRYEFIAGRRNVILPLRPGSGQALSFNGTNQYVNLGDSDSLDLAGTPFTIEAWIKMPATIGTQQHTIVGKGINNTTIAYRFDVSGATRRAGIVVGNGVSTAGITTLIPIPNDEWTHVAVTYDGVYILNVYQNGVLQNTGIAPFITIPNGADSTRIGASLLSSTNFFQGQIDEVRIWNVVRSQADIRNTMCQKLTGSEAGLVGYYRFDEGTGATTYDWANGYDGILVNTPAWITSGAALGDISAAQYDAGVNVGVADVDLFTASFIATPLTLGQGVHVYKVRQAPNVTILPAGTTFMETSRYFGVFKVNAPNVDITYKYDANPNINNTPQEYSAVFLERDNNADFTWSLPLTPTGFAFTPLTNKFMSPPNPMTATHREFVIAFTSSIPTIQASNIQFTSVTSNSIGLQWTNGNGQNRIVVMSTSPFFTPPTNGTSYPVGQNIGTGIVIYNGNGNITIANGLIPKTPYYFHVFEYNGTGTTTIYNPAPAVGNPKFISTLSIAPQNQPTGISFFNITTTTASVSFTPARPLAEGYLAVIRQPTDLPTPPADGAEYAIGTKFFSGQIVVFSGASTSFDLKGLLPATTYIIDIYAFNGSGANTAYNKINPLSGEFKTLAPLPQLISISPNIKTVGEKGFTMQINGNGFIKETKALWFGQPLATAFVNATTLTAEVPDNRLFEAGIFPISVSSPSPGGGNSNALPFTVIPAVNIQSIPLISRIVPPDKNNHLLYRLEFFSIGGETVLSSIKFSTAGSYQITDLKELGFTLWTSSDENLDDTDNVLLSLPRVSSGSILTFDLSKTSAQIKLPKNGRVYLLLTVNIASEAKQGNEIKINGVKFEDIVFANLATKQGKDPAEEGTFQKITASSPAPQDYSALVRFFNDMGGKNWIEPWNLDNPVTTWKGVELDEDGKVIALSLPNNNLVGKLSNAVMQDGILISQTLRYINLSGNKIEGQLPIDLKNLNNLEYLDLSNNLLSGSIGSEINSLTNLVTLWLAYNQFVEIDIDFAKLVHLKNLFLQDNNLQKLNDNIGDLPNLEILNLQGNQLKKLPETIGKLRKIKYLDISSNELTEVPKSIVNLLSLERLLMHDNFIKLLPNGMTNLQNLTLLTTYDNFLEFGSFEPLRSWWAGGQHKVNIIYSPQGKIGQPQEFTFQVGSPVTLKIETTGTANQYQWFKNSTPIAGANSATLTIPNLAAQNAGTYSLQVTNHLVPDLTLQSHDIALIADCGRVQSGSKPIINIEGASVFCGLEPINTRLTTPENVNIIAYQWFFNGIQINNSNRNSILAQDAGKYQVRIFTKDGCSLFSDELSITTLPNYSVTLVQNQLTLQAIVTAGRQISNYEWFLNDRIIPNATQGAYSPVEVGTYRVRVTDTNGCRSVSNPLLVNVVSTEENIYEGKVIVYPNPSTAVFYLELGEEKANKIQLFNALGKYYNEKITSLGAKKFQIDLNNQARGLYFIEITTDKGKIVRKIVKE